MSSSTTLKQKVRATDGGRGLNNLNTGTAIYSFATDGGAVATITPRRTFVLPRNAVIVGAVINSITACTSGGAATISVGTSAGSSATSILGATAIASFTTNALLAPAVSFAAPVKLTATGGITVTVATATVTAGVIEVSVVYTQAHA